MTKKKTTVKAHPRKGTKGVTQHTRKITTPIRKIVPTDSLDLRKYYDEIIVTAENLLEQTETIAKEEIDLEHKWMDLETKRLRLQRQGLKIPKELLKEQEKIRKKIFKQFTKRMKIRKAIQEVTTEIPVKERRKIIRRSHTYRGITKMIS
jgi:hypothetical protein